MSRDACPIALTRAEIEDRLEEAALTLRRLPNPAGSGARGYGASWPEYIRDVKHAYGYHEAQMKVIPNAREIQRMEDAIDWLRLIVYADDPDRTAIDRRIVWMRAENHRWRHVCRTVGLGRSQAWRRWVAALITIERRLAADWRKRKVATPPGTGG
jgi:hypothetical protein